MKFDSDASAAQRSAVAEGIRGLTGSISQIQHLTVGTDAGIREGNFDLAAVVDFDDRDAYATYAAHPAHVELLNSVIAPILTDRAAVQFEI